MFYRLRLVLVEEATVNAKHQISTRVFPLEYPQGEEFFLFSFQMGLAPKKRTYPCAYSPKFNKSAKQIKFRGWNFFFFREAPIFRT